jgi:hypothetical protein
MVWYRVIKEYYNVDWSKVWIWALVYFSSEDFENFLLKNWYIELWKNI